MSKPTRMIIVTTTTHIQVGLKVNLVPTASMPNVPKAKTDQSASVKSNHTGVKCPQVDNLPFSDALQIWPPPTPNVSEAESQSTSGKFIKVAGETKSDLNSYEGAKVSIKPFGPAVKVYRDANGKKFYEDSWLIHGKQSRSPRIAKKRPSLTRSEAKQKVIEANIHPTSVKSIKVDVNNSEGAKLSTKQSSSAVKPNLNGKWEWLKSLKPKSPRIAKRRPSLIRSEANQNVSEANIHPTTVKSIDGGTKVDLNSLKSAKLSCPAVNIYQDANGQRFSMEMPNSQPFSTPKRLYLGRKQSKSPRFAKKRPSLTYSDAKQKISEAKTDQQNSATPSQAGLTCLQCHLHSSDSLHVWLPPTPNVSEPESQSTSVKSNKISGGTKSDLNSSEGAKLSIKQSQSTDKWKWLRTLKQSHSKQSNPPRIAKKRPSLTSSEAKRKISEANSQSTSVKSIKVSGGKKSNLNSPNSAKLSTKQSSSTDKPNLNANGNGPKFFKQSHSRNSKNSPNPNCPQQ